MGYGILLRCVSLVHRVAPLRIIIVFSFITASSRCQSIRDEHGTLWPHSAITKAHTKFENRLLLKIKIKRHFSSWRLGQALSVCWSYSTAQSTVHVTNFNRVLILPMWEMNYFLVWGRSKHHFIKVSDVLDLCANKKQLHSVQVHEMCISKIFSKLWMSKFKWNAIKECSM